MARGSHPIASLGRRPLYGPAERARVWALVAAQRAIQGRTAGNGPIAKALPGVPLRLIREALAAQKAQERRARQQALEAARRTHEVTRRDVIWAEDGAQWGRVKGGAVLGEVVRDAATTTTIALSAGPPPTAREVKALLERTAKERGGLPLVLQRDNGAIYAERGLRTWLRREHVITLRSRVHTPTDNPVAERAIGELRAETGLRPSTRLATAAQALDRLRRAQARLNAGRLRASRGHRTAASLDATLCRADAQVDRRRFYAAACSAMRKAVRGIADSRAARAAEREAIVQTLIGFDLVRRHVGAHRRTGQGGRLQANPPAARMPT